MSLVFAHYTMSSRARGHFFPTNPVGRGPVFLILLPGVREKNQLDSISLPAKIQLPILSLPVPDNLLQAEFISSGDLR